MKILTRYVLREHVAPFLAAATVITGLMLLNQLAKRFGDLVGKGLPWYVIAEVFGLSVPFILAMTLPMAVLVAVLYTFARLSGDNEITAIKAGGVSLLRLMVPVLMASVAIASGMVWFNDTVLPESNHALRRLLTDINRKQPTFELRERVINEVVPGEFFLQAARIDRARSMLWDMAIFDLGRKNAERTIYADSGHMAFNVTQTDLFLTLYDGSMHEIEMDDPAGDQRTYYAKQLIRVPGVTNELERGRSGDYRGDREMNIRMMEAEIASRRDALREVRDSVQRLTEQLRPPAIADTDRRAASDREPGVAPATELGTRVPPRADRRPPAADGDEPGADRPTRAEDTIAASAIDETAAQRRRPRRDIRAALPTARSRVWPPEGDPVIFASQVRSEFHQLSVKHSIHRREVSRYAVEIHKKFSIPAAAIVFVLLGAPIGVRYPRGGIGMVIGVSLAVFCTYYVFLIGGEELADRSIITPFWAMWAPNVLTGIAGVFVMARVVRHGAHARTTSPLAFLRRLLPGGGTPTAPGAGPGDDAPGIGPGDTGRGTVPR